MSAGWFQVDLDSHSCFLGHSDLGRTTKASSLQQRAPRPGGTFKMSNFYLRVSSKHVGAFRRLQTKGLRPLLTNKSLSWHCENETPPNLRGPNFCSQALWIFRRQTNCPSSSTRNLRKVGENIKFYLQRSVFQNSRNFLELNQTNFQNAISRKQNPPGPGL